MNIQNITLTASDENEYKIAELTKKSKLLLYFYPKDNTPGCTNEAKDFTRLKKKFSDQDIEIVGVSPDSVESHQNFITKQELDILLLSDPDKELATEMGAYGEKKNYEKTYMGIIRSTFLIDMKSGKVIEAWRNVRAKGHGDRICKLVCAKEN